MIAPPSSTGDRPPVNILVVDDRPENRMALTAMLARPDYRIVEAGSARDALLRLLEDEFAVLLIDVLMPGMSGFELATLIRERERTASVPIVFMTAQAADIDLVAKGYRCGGVDYLVTPLIPELVRAKVAVFAELDRQRRQLADQAARLVDAERKDSELRLAELRLASERRFRGLAEATPNIMWTARVDGLIDYFNHRWFEYTGITVEQAAGSWYGAVHADDVAACASVWQDALRAGRMHEVECRLRRADDGAYRWHLGRVVPEVGSTGLVTGWIGSFTDIEDQKRAHAVLAEFKGTLDAVLDAVLIFEPEQWRFLYVNQGASVMLGYSPDELLRMRPTDFVAHQDIDEFREVLARLQDGRRSMTSVETAFRRRDGRAIPVEVSVQLIHVDGGRIVAIARDITDRKRAQLERELLYREAVDAIRARDEFLSVASHELRTPLSSLQLLMEVLVHPPSREPRTILSPEQAKTKLELAARQVGRLSRLVGELMDVSRISGGRLKLEVEELDLAALVRDVVARLATDAAKAQSPVQLHAAAPVVGTWDGLRIEQVVMNLLTNAFKFGAGKPIDVEVERDGAIGRVSVRDRGIGIAAEDIDRIFHRFEQAISSRTYGGMGLGLYIVRQIVEAHGGTISVESQRGAGSTFTVELPLEPPPVPARAGSESGDGGDDSRVEG